MPDGAKEKCNARGDVSHVQRENNAEDRFMCLATVSHHKI